MSNIEFDLDPSVEIRGSIHDGMDERYLREDEMEIELPSGITISVAWDHESGAHGRFVLFAFREYWDNHVMTAFAIDTRELQWMIPWMVGELESGGNESDFFDTPKLSASQFELHEQESAVSFDNAIC